MLLTHFTLLVHPELKFVSNHQNQVSIEVLEVRNLEFEVAEQMLFFIMRSLLRAKKLKTDKLTFSGRFL
jgi:hypothetical protein